MCSGRVDLKFIFRAFSNGADGVFVGGCHLNDCHYNPEGNYDALIVSRLTKILLERIGVNPERFRLEWVSAGEGIRFAEIMNEFSNKVKQLGPLGSNEKIDFQTLKFRFESVAKLIPYIKLVERERLRIPVRTEVFYHNYLASGELDKLFKEIIEDKLAMSQILLLLKEKPLTTGEISEKLGMNPSDVSKYMNHSSRYGFVRFDVTNNRYACA